MKKQILDQLQKIKSEKRLGLMTHIVAGYPDLEVSKQLVVEMANAGVDFVEIQIPFSDPMADGPTIMKANKIALDNKTKPKDAMKLMSELSKEIQIPLIFMSYFNIVLSYGVEKFCKDAKEAGCSGLIIPDMPIEEEVNEHLTKYANENDLINIRLLSPASTEERIKMNTEIAEGFIYYAGRKGTTGAQSDMDQELNMNISKVKNYSNLPIAVGFGISEKSHIEAVKNAGAQIAALGSSMINTLDTKGISGVKKFLNEIISAL